MNAIDKEAEETGTEWVEDADGNFVKKKRGEYVKRPANGGRYTIPLVLLRVA